MKNLILALSFLFSASAFAASSPLSLSIVNPVEFPPDDYNVTGARFSLLWGHHRNVYGLDVGVLGNITDLEFVGIAISGVFNITHGDTTAVGMQFAGLANYNSNKFRAFGLQAALGANINQAESSVTGVQLSLINYAPYTKIYGVQVGVYNRALSVYGLQLGLVNIADNVHGFQIGLINFNHTGLFYVAPIINFGF